MKRTSIWLCSLALVCVSVCSAADLQFDVFPTVQDQPPLEFDLFSMVDPCPCPEKDCTCDADKCICPDCDKHTDNEDVIYVDIDKGRHVLLFSADWCAPCQAAKKRLGDLVDEVVHVDFDERKDLVKRFGVSKIPTAVLVVDGKETSRCEGSHIGKLIVGGWIDKKETKGQTTAKAPTVSFSCSDGSCRTYSQPVYYSSRQPVYTGGCATCRR